MPRGVSARASVVPRYHMRYFSGVMLDSPACGIPVSETRRGGVKEKADAAVVQNAWHRLLPGMLEDYDSPKSLPCIAPRPLFVVNGRDDPRCGRPNLNISHVCCRILLFIPQTSVMLQVPHRRPERDVPELPQGIPGTECSCKLLLLHCTSWSRSDAGHGCACCELLREASAP